MDAIRHVIVVHHTPMVVEALEMVLSAQGFTVHAAATYRHAQQLLRQIHAELAAVVAHADMPNEPSPGTLLRMARAMHPAAALVVLSARARRDLGPLPRTSVLLREPFDRAELMAAIVMASDPRSAKPAQISSAASSALPKRRTAFDGGVSSNVDR